MIRKQTAVSSDNSNSATRVVTHNESIHYLNTLQEVDENLLSNLLKKNQKLYTYQKKTYIKGVLGGTGSGSKDESRYYSDDFRKETVLALSDIVTSEHEIIKMCTGLPASLSQRDDIIKKMKRNLKGEYEVIINYNGQEQIKTFNITDVIIVSQPLGTLWYRMYNKDGSLKSDDQSIKYMKFLIIDPGYGTTDLIELSAAKGLGNNKTLSFAMSDYIADLYNAIEKEYPDSRLSAAIENPYELDELLLNSDVLVLPRGKFKVGHIKERLQTEMALKIKNALDKFGYNFEIYHEIILTGGGGKTLEKAIRKVFNNDPRIILIDDPIMANAQGFYIIARQYFKI